MSTTDRYQAAHVITKDAQDRWLSPGVVDVVDGRITWVGTPEDAPPLEDGQVHDVRGALLPGFVDTHAHTPMVLLRGAGEGLPVDRWLTEVMWPREAQLTEDDVRVGMTFGAAQLLTNGWTTSAEMYFHPDAMADGAQAAGLRCVIGPPLLVAEGMEALGPWEQQLESAVAFAERYRDVPTIDGAISPHSAYAVSEVPLREAGRVAADQDLLLHTHVAEMQHEGDEITAEHGVTVPRYLESIGVLEAQVLAAHGVWLTDDDIACLAEHRVGVAHCPGSNGKHASGTAPVTELKAAGVPVAIATDGPASHDRLDPFEEMRLAIRTARLRAGQADAMSAADALTMVTRDAATALGRDDLGAIEAGRRADLLAIDTAAPDLVPVTEPGDLLTHLVWSGSPSLVRRVWVDGREVVTDGQAVEVDAATLAADVTSRARRLAVG